jgi:hypothetical protein
MTESRSVAAMPPFTVPSGLAKAIEASGGAIVRRPYNDAHERRAVVYDHKGNGLVFYRPSPG